MDHSALALAMQEKCPLLSGDKDLRVAANSEGVEIHDTVKEKGLKIEAEKKFEVIFRGQKVGLYAADLIVEGLVIIELKCCDSLVGEHQAQLINYLKVSGILVGLLVNFGNRKVEFKRLHHPDHLPFTPILMNMI